MDRAIRQALTWVTLCLAIVMSAFTWADVSSGEPSTAMWLNAVVWPVVAILTGWILRKNPYRPSNDDDQPRPAAGMSRQDRAAEKDIQ